MEMRRRKNKKKHKRRGEGDEESSSDSEDFYFKDNAYLKNEFKKMHRNELDEE